MYKVSVSAVDIRCLEDKDDCTAKWDSSVSAVDSARRQACLMDSGKCVTNWDWSVSAVDVGVSKTKMTVRRSETEVYLHWTQLGDDRGEVIDVREIDGRF